MDPFFGAVGAAGVVLVQGPLVEGRDSEGGSALRGRETGRRVVGDGTSGQLEEPGCTRM